MQTNIARCRNVRTLFVLWEHSLWCVDLTYLSLFGSLQGWMTRWQSTPAHQECPPWMLLSCTPYRDTEISCRCTPLPPTCAHLHTMKLTSYTSPAVDLKCNVLPSGFFKIVLKLSPSNIILTLLLVENQFTKFHVMEYLLLSQDYTHEFHKTKANFLAIREREDLLGSVRKDIEWVSIRLSISKYVIGKLNHEPLLMFSFNTN